MFGLFRTFLTLVRVSFLKRGGGDIPIRELETLDDHELMKRYAENRDTIAFEILLNRYRSQLFGYLIRACKNRSKAEDLYQETFFRVIRAAPRYTANASFRTWLFSIARNLIIDEHRKSKHQNRWLHPVKTFDESKSDEIETSASHRPGTEQHVQAMEIRRILAHALKSLSEDQREIFHLRESAGLSFQEAAAIAGCSVNTAKSRMRYAMIKIRETFEKNGVLPQETS